MLSVLTSCDIHIIYFEMVTLGLPLFNVKIKNWQGCCERQSFCPDWESSLGWVQSPVNYPLDYRYNPVKGEGERIKTEPKTLRKPVSGQKMNTID